MTLHHKIKGRAVLLGTILSVAVSLFSFQAQYSLEEVRKVYRLIDQLLAGEDPPGDGSLRMVKVTESEFNSYIAYRIEAEKEDLMKELRFKFLKKNKLEGKVYVDLRGRDIPRILRPEMTFYFSGELETRDRQVKLNLDKLFLEDQEIRPEVLDIVILLGSQIGGWDAGSLNDWYDLPYGIRDIKVHMGYAEFYF